MRGGPFEARTALLGFALFVGALTVCFWKPLWDLGCFAARSDLYSHVFLVPVISIYLVWLRRRSLPRFAAPTARLAALPLLLGGIAIVSYWVARAKGAHFALDDYLCLMMSSFFCFVVGGALTFLGARVLGAVAFPMAFLVFMVPYPAMLLQWIEAFFQHTSAAAAQLLFQISGTPVFRSGTSFQLPNLTIRVAEECSGIRSSLVLFLTSLLAGSVFLHNPWRRAVLTLAVIPLAIVRNGFRVFTIAMLTLHVDPEIIDGPLHHRGGPLFFLLSLVPFFMLLLWLRKSDRGLR